MNNYFKPDDSQLGRTTKIDIINDLPILKENNSSLSNKNSNNKNKKKIIIIAIITFVMAISIVGFSLSTKGNKAKQPEEENKKIVSKDTGEKVIKAGNKFAFDYNHENEEISTISITGTFSYRILDRKKYEKTITSSELDEKETIKRILTDELNIRLNNFFKGETTQKRYNKITELYRNSNLGIEYSSITINFTNYNINFKKENQDIKIDTNSETIPEKEDIIDNDKELIENNKEEPTNKKIKEITTTDLQTKIGNKEQFILIITQSTCSNCVEYKEKINEILNEYNINIFEIDLLNLNSEEKNYIKEQYSIVSTPTTIFYCGSNTAKQVIGNISKEQIINKLKELEYIKK